LIELVSVEAGGNQRGVRRDLRDLYSVRAFWEFRKPVLAYPWIWAALKACLPRDSIAGGVE
jgi:hypothetical protein